MVRNPWFKMTFYPLVTIICPGPDLVTMSNICCISILEVNLVYCLIFFRLGTTIASHPFKVICATLLLCVLGCVGLIYFEFETDAEKLWLPRNASFIVNKVTFLGNLLNLMSIF